MTVLVVGENGYGILINGSTAAFSESSRSSVEITEDPTGCLRPIAVIRKNKKNPARGRVLHTT